MRQADVFLLTSTFFIYVNAINSKPDIDPLASLLSSQTRYEECLDKGKTSGKSVEAALCSDLEFLSIELDKFDIERYFEGLQSFTLTLEAYVNSACFDYDHFEESRNHFEETLSHLTSMARYFQKTKEIMAPLKYGAELLTLMAESARIMADQTYLETNGRDIVYKFISLNIKLLTLHNSLGSLVESPSETNRHIFGYFRDLVSWKSEYDSLNNPSMFMTVILYDQSRKARRSLELLRQKFEASLISNFESDRFIRFG